MSQLEKNTIQQLATLIMSSNLSNEVQQEALQCLKPYPDVLLSLLKKSCRNDGEHSKNSTNEQSPKSTNEQSPKSTNEKSPNSTNEQNQKLINEQSQKSTNEHGQKSTNEQSQKSTNKQSQKSTNEHSQTSTNEKSQKSTNKQSKESTNDCRQSIHEKSTTDGYEHPTNDESPSRSCSHSMHNKSANRQLENNSYDRNEKGSSNQTLNNAQTDSDDKKKSKDLDTDDNVKLSKKVYIGGSSAGDKDESRPKKRKSKYSDIQGDLSHIWREPKCETSRRQTKKRKYTKRKDGGEKQNKDTDKQKDIKLVRKLIENVKTSEIKAAPRVHIDLTTDGWWPKKVIYGREGEDGKADDPSLQAIFIKR